MANIKSQKKRNLQNEAARQRNKGVRSSLKTRVRSFEEAVSTGDKEAATTAFGTVTKELDQAAAKGVIHKNKAANKKARLAKRLNQI